MKSNHKLESLMKASVAPGPYLEGYGITLRQHFAGLAMQGCLAYSYCNPQSGNYHENSDAQGVAKAAVAYADALLAELAKDPT